MSIADRIIARAQRTPYFHLKGYMERFWLVPYTETGSASTTGCGWVSWGRPLARMLQAFGIAARVHHILRSDEGRDPHDHPWPYLTVILKGGYIEHRYTPGGHLLSSKWHGPGSVLFRKPGDFHMLELPQCMGLDEKYHEDSVWTLFVTGRYAQKWGFVRDGVKVPHNVYLAEKHGHR
jgi:hypothetical protein